MNRASFLASFTCVCWPCNACCCLYVSLRCGYVKQSHCLPRSDQQFSRKTEVLPNTFEYLWTRPFPPHALLKITSNLHKYASFGYLLCPFTLNVFWARLGMTTKYTSWSHQWHNKDMSLLGCGRFECSHWLTTIFFFYWTSSYTIFWTRPSPLLCTAYAFKITCVNGALAAVAN